MEDRYLTRQFINDDGVLVTLACTGRKDKKGELVYEGDTIFFTLPNDTKNRKGAVVYHDDLMTYFVENDEIEEELWKIEILEIIE